MWKGQCLSFSGDVDSTAHTIAPPKISAVAKSMESGVHACLPSGRASPRPPFPLLLFLLPSLKTRIAFYRPREFTPSRSLLADETRKITRNHANLRNVSFRFVSSRLLQFTSVSFLSLGFVISSLSLSRSYHRCER